MRTINKIIIHHSAVEQPDVKKLLNSINRTHKERLHKKENGYWNYCAYHYLIWVDWKILKTRPLEEIGYHASNRPVNKTSIWICLSWDFDITQPTQAQFEALIWLIKELKTGFKRLDVEPHNKYSKKTCPWKNFDINRLYKLLEKKPLTWKTYKILSKMNSIIYNRIDHQEIRNLLHRINEIIRWE